MRDVSHYKGEGRSQIIKDRNIEKNYETFCQPVYTLLMPAEILNIHTGKLSDKDINIDKWVEIGSEQIKKFDQLLSKEFYDSLSEQVQTMSIL